MRGGVAPPAYAPCQGSGETRGGRRPLPGSLHHCDALMLSHADIVIISPLGPHVGIGASPPAGPPGTRDLPRRRYIAAV
eukprot:411823-Prorocentrum_minimum.AAC.1